MANTQEYSNIRYNGSAAYEIAYEPQIQEQENTNVGSLPKQHKAVKPAYGISAFAIAGYVAVAVVFVLVLMTYVQYTAVAAETVEYRELIETLSEDQRKLTIEYEMTFDLNDVELYAKSYLGMDTPRNEQIKEVALDATDKAIVYGQDGENSLFSSFAAVFATVMEYFD